MNVRLAILEIFVKIVINKINRQNNRTFLFIFNDGPLPY
jgi:hypothetical protein